MASLRAYGSAVKDGRPGFKGFGKGGIPGSMSEVCLSGQGLNDEQLAEWCSLLHGSCLLHLVSLNLSNNFLADAGGATLVSLLKEIGAPVRVLQLYKNQLGDGAARAIAEYIMESKHAVAEVHLSHNCIQQDGVICLLKAAAAAEDKTGGPRYPSFETVSLQKAVPLWLRLEHNCVDLVPPGHISHCSGTLIMAFLDYMEGQLLQVRREKKWVDMDDRLPPPGLLCESTDGCGCSSQRCALLCPGGVGGSPGGPVVHVPWLRRQRPVSAAILRRPSSGSRHMLALGAQGYTAASGIGPGASSMLRHPPQVLPRARSPVRFSLSEEEERKAKAAEKAVGLGVVRQCRFTDFRLGMASAEGGQPGQGAEAAAAPKVIDSEGDATVDEKTGSSLSSLQEARLPWYYDILTSENDRAAFEELLQSEGLMRSKGGLPAEDTQG